MAVYTGTCTSLLMPDGDAAHVQKFSMVLINSLPTHGPPTEQLPVRRVPWRFSLVLELRIHSRGIHDARKYACLWCPRYFINKQELLKHSKEYHTFSCNLCNYIFPSQIELVAHQAVKHGRLASEEQEHQEEQASEEMPHCAHSFPSQKDLDDHTIKFHTFVCGKCRIGLPPRQDS